MAILTKEDPITVELKEILKLASKDRYCPRDTVAALNGISHRAAYVLYLLSKKRRRAAQ